MFVYIGLPESSNSSSSTDSAPDIIISIRQQPDKASNDVWSHFTISGGNAYQFRSFRDAENQNQRVEPCNQNAFSFSPKVYLQPICILNGISPFVRAYTQPIKQESTCSDNQHDASRDLAEILAANTLNVNAFNHHHQSRNNMPHHQIPIMHGRQLPFGVAQNAQIGNMNVINNFHIRNMVSNNANYQRAQAQIVPNYNPRPITRITSLIPAPEYFGK